MRIRTFLPGLALALVACAGSPPTVPAVAQATVAPGTAPAGTAAAPAATAANSADVVRQKLLADGRGEGYRPSVHNGTTLYCKTDADTGTHIPRQVCLNEDQLVEQMRVMAQNRENWAVNRTCGNVGCSGSMSSGK